MVVLLALGAGATDAMGQQPGDAEIAAVAQELAALNRTMADIASLLRAQAERSEVELLLTRVELAQRAIAPREAQLETARSQLARLTQEDALLQAEYDRIDQRARSAGQPGSEVTDEQIQQERLQLDTHLKLRKDQIRSVQQRVIDLENELAGQQRALATWEEEIDRRLGLR
jgi:chromosome segregation ATPase